MTQPVTPAEMQQCAAFSNLTDAECDTLAPFLERDSVVAGTTILTQGHSTQALWVVLDGQCEVVKPKAKGGTTVLATLEQGTVFGEMSFFDGSPHSASVDAKTNVSLFWLPREAYDKLESQSPELTHRIALYIATLLSDRLRKMDEWVTSTVENPDAKYKKEWLEFRTKLFN